MYSRCRIRWFIRIFNTDKTYFVLNGSSGSVKTALSALILYDRNNYKSVYIGGLIDAWATPVYLEISRNPFGSIGGILENCFNEKYIRNLIIYDGTITNAKQIVEKKGKICDYIVQCY